MVIGMLRGMSDAAKQQQREIKEYFWTKSPSSNYYKRVPIQAWTALLKAYAHSGEMSKADSLFVYLMSSSSVASGGGKKRKQTDDKNNHRNSPNVRTFNTLLRGCMWTAASITDDYGDNEGRKDASGKKDKKKKKQQQQQAPASTLNALVGGVPTAKRAWSLGARSSGHDSKSMIQFDTSSYEYFVTILSQSLRCKDALRYLDQMKLYFGVELNSLDVDPSIMESLIVCLVAISRGYVMTGDFNQALKCAIEALGAMEQLQSSLSSSGGDASNSSSGGASSKKMVTGGKRAWNEGKGSGGDADDNGNEPNGRREESNKLFRSHRLSELRSEAMALKNACGSSNHPEESIATHDAKYFARLMMTRLFYFSGGGTTQTTAVGDDIKAVKKVDNSLTYQQWIHSLWHSFGLRETTQRALYKDEELQTIFSTKQKKNGNQLPDLLSSDLCDSLRQQIVGENCNVLSDDGCLNFDSIFQIKGKGEESLPLHIELGSGSGDWCVTQSKLNPNENYVTVELRADRVAQTFFKCITQNTWKNMCCVGSDCGSFLRDRVSSSQCRTIFVNHPEPPTQTYDDDESSEEPAHMLNSANIKLAANCLEGGGKGRLVVVTDNLIYARFLCRTITRVMEDGSLDGLHPSEARDLRTVDSFYVGNSNTKLWLYEGKPSSSIGHFDAKEWAGKGDWYETDKGTSYFDRLWRTGAGKHADVKKRYIVVVCTSGGERGSFSGGATATQSFSKKRYQSDHGRKRNDNNNSSGKQKEKKPKKRSAEAQKRRNERRLLKKEQARQEEKGGS